VGISDLWVGKKERSKNDIVGDKEYRRVPIPNTMKSTDLDPSEFGYPGGLPECIEAIRVSVVELYQHLN